MGPIARLLTPAIGLASEAIAARKLKKSGQAGQIGVEESSAGEGTSAPQGRQESGTISLDPGHDDGKALAQHDESRKKADEAGADFDPVSQEAINDEEDWELDEAADDLIEETQTPLEGKEQKPDIRKLLQAFLQAHPRPPSFQPDPLPCAVILPQRRPRHRARGFVRAYAPVLADCGIDQETWMTFLGTFEKSSQASPIFTGIQISGKIIGSVPSVAAMAAGISMQVVGGAGVALHSLSRTNTFLDDVNEHFFRPRGLFAILIQYKGNRHRWSSEPLDVSKAVAASATAADASKQGNIGTKIKHNLQFGGGKSHGEMEMLQAAPLVYPSLDLIATDTPTGEGANRDNTEKSKTWAERYKSSSAFVSTYKDNRAQAKFAIEDPNSGLNLPADQQPRFASRYADPNHPASSGSLISMVTGGYIDPKGRRRQRNERLKARGGLIGALGAVRHTKPVKRMMTEGVLYLMVVNWPGDGAVAKAKAEMEGQVKVERDDAGEEIIVVVGEKE